MKSWSVLCGVMYRGCGHVFSGGGGVLSVRAWQCKGVKETVTSP